MYSFRCIIPNDRKICLFKYKVNDNNKVNNNKVNDSNKVNDKNNDNDNRNEDDYNNDNNDDDDDDLGEKTTIKYQDKDSDSIVSITLSELGVRNNFTYTKRLVFLQESHYRNCFLNSLSEDCCDCDLITLKGIDHILSKGCLADGLIVKHIDNVLNFGLFADIDHDINVILGEYVGLLVPFSAHDKPTGYGMNYPCGDDSYEINAFDFGNVIRFINHSVNPNADFRKVFFEGLVHVVCSTIKEIKRGEQITVNYGASYWIARKNDIKVDII